MFSLYQSQTCFNHHCLEGAKLCQKTIKQSKLCHLVHVGVFPRVCTHLPNQQTPRPPGKPLCRPAPRLKYSCPWPITGPWRTTRSSSLPGRPCPCRNYRRQLRSRRARQSCSRRLSSSTSRRPRPRGQCRASRSGWSRRWWAARQEDRGGNSSVARRRIIAPVHTGAGVNNE